MNPKDRLKWAIYLLDVRMRQARDAIRDERDAINRLNHAIRCANEAWAQSTNHNVGEAK